MEINFYLRRNEPDSTGKCAIMLAVLWDGERVRKSLGLKLSPDGWDDTRQFPKGGSDNAPIRTVLNTVRSRFDTLFAEHNQHPPLAVVEDTLRAIPDQIRSGNWDQPASPPILLATPKEPLVTDFVTTYRSDHKAVIGSESLRVYNQIMDHLVTFAREVEGINDLRFEHLTLGFALRYVNYLTDTCGLSDNTAYGHLSKIRPVIKYAQVQNISICKDFTLWPRSNTPASKHWHPQSELDQLTTIYTGGSSLSAVAGTYLLACYTALRVSDLQRFNPALHIKEIKPSQAPPYRLLDLTSMVKTKERLTVHLNDYAWEIIQHFGGNPFQQMEGKSEQKYNVNIKKVGAAAALDRMVEMVRYQNGKRSEVVRPITEVMSSHTARHTYACNSIIRGMNVTVLQKHMGHKSLNSTMQYVHLADAWMHQQSLDAWKKPQ